MIHLAETSIRGTRYISHNQFSIQSQERTLITIEFAPSVSKEETKFTHKHPKFVFGNHVCLISEFPSIDYIVCAIELVESTSPSGRLLAQPFWKYKISNGEESHWRDESALTFFHDQQSLGTCSTCQYFNDYKDPRGCGWCNLFDRQARTNHIKTHDCVLNTQAEAFPSEVIEVDREGYPMDKETVENGYFDDNFTTYPNEPF